jgi:hypothetical protein
MRLCNGATYFRAQAKYSTQQFVTALRLLIMIVLALFFLSRSAQKYSISAPPKVSIGIFHLSFAFEQIK